MDIIDVSPDDLVLPGDCLGGAIGLGRIGPFDECGGPWFPAAGRADPYGEMWCEEHGSRCSDSAPLAVYDCRDEWLRDRLRRVLAAGERCPRWTGNGCAADTDCAHPDCNGTGYTRQPHDLGHFIDAEIAGRITPLAAAGLMWASVLRVGAGLGPVTYVNGAEDRRRRSPTMSDVSALLDNDHILLPLPDRIARLRLED